MDKRRKERGLSAWGWADFAGNIALVLAALWFLIWGVPLLLR